jgi:hypothetical protein
MQTKLQNKEIFDGLVDIAYLVLLETLDLFRNYYSYIYLKNMIMFVLCDNKAFMDMFYAKIRLQELRFCTNSF